MSDTATAPTTTAVDAPVADAPTRAPEKLTVRRISFPAPQGMPRHFMDGDPVMSHIVATLSAIFPAGEDYFVRSVRNYRDKITDPELKKQVAGFIGQEAIHGREHREFNQHLAELGFPSRAIDRFIDTSLHLNEKIRPKSVNLAVTAALEHYTASLAELLLGDEQARAEFGETGKPALDLLTWHAIEESEHKDVAFDVFQATVGSEKIRTRTMKLITVGFLLTAGTWSLVSLAGDAHTWRHPVRTAKSFARLRTNPWLSKAMRTKIWDYNREGFHPSDHDATELLAEWRERLFGTEGELTPHLQTRKAA